MPLRDDKLPLDVLRRVMPTPPPDPNAPPRDPTLLEIFTHEFQYGRQKTSDVSDAITDDGKAG